MRTHLYLSGFMGSGKSTIGPLLAKAFGMPFVDLDSALEKKFKKSVATFFKNFGEAEFRREETKMLLALQAKQPSVISLGGGAILSFQNREILKRGVWVHLDANPARLKARLARARNRPLLKGIKTDPSIFDSLWRSRAPLYALAPYSVRTEDLVPEAVCEKILFLIGRKIK